MTKEFDAIVIGTGCGGAAAAAFTGHLGYRTLVLEKNRRIGGRTVTIERRGFKMDHGHVVLRCEKGPHGEVLRRVGCADLIPRFSHASLWPTRTVIEHRVVDTLPNMLFYWLSLRGLLDIFRIVGSVKELLNILRFFRYLHFMSEDEIAALDRVDLKSFVSRFTSNPFMHALFNGVITVSFGADDASASAGEFARIARSTRRDFFKSGYPKNGEGIAAIPKSFLRAARRYGADIRTHAGVEKILVENNAVKGVHLNGDFIPARIVVSNAGIRETVLRLTGPEHFDKDYVRRIENLRYSYGGISLKYALTRPVTRFTWGGVVPPRMDRIAHDMRAGHLPEQLPFMYIVTSNIDKSLAPPGCQLVSVISGGPATPPGRIDWDPWINRLKNQVADFFPGIEKHLLFLDVSTPDRIARFNGRSFGDAVGVAQTVDQVGPNRPSVHTSIKGLYCVGADVGSGGIATELASLSAIELAGYLERLR